MVKNLQVTLIVAALSILAASAVIFVPGGIFADMHHDPKRHDGRRRIL